MLTVPDRALAVGFGAIVTETVPLPSPLAPEVTVSHERLLEAVQAHCSVVVTATVAVSPAATDVRDDGEIE